MATLEELDTKVDNLTVGIAEIKAALTYDDIGLIPTVTRLATDFKDFKGKHEDEFEGFKKEYYSFRKIVFIVIGSLVGSGALGAGVYELLNSS